MSTSTLARQVWRSTASLSAALIAAVLTAGTAAAHVSTEPSEVSREETSRISFRVPNESPTAGTIKVELTLPAEHPISSLRTEEKPGWTSHITKAKLDKPVKVDGADVTEAVRTVTWTANPGTRIGPEQFGVFSILTSSLPDTTDELVIPAVQVYEDGKVANWSMPPLPNGEEPESPAPTLKLTGAAEEAPGGATNEEPAAATPQSSAPVWLAGAGAGLGALALGVAIGALLRGRRTGTTGNSSDA